MADATASRLDAVRNQIGAVHRAPEPEVLAPLLKQAMLAPDSRARVERRARAMLSELRAAQSRGWVNQFLQEYRLNTQEGVALLSLAEAFGAPDPGTPHNEARGQVWEELLALLLDKHRDQHDDGEVPAELLRRSLVQNRGLAEAFDRALRERGDSHAETLSGLLPIAYVEGRFA